ncbi:MAG: hypothetical protein ACD_28C00111G0002 [uncultured bacterium]|nr:MAG: hypothetical protein ACD_28C00111G0002 [uncultured bacterium]KKT76298.1 MAG: hypothetical protein UW70_C0019G0016 [Candidatus Peregrinibacteria bacterium GW2011_GWA2_44_7]
MKERIVLQEGSISENLLGSIGGSSRIEVVLNQDPVNSLREKTQSRANATGTYESRTNDPRLNRSGKRNH